MKIVQVNENLKINIESIYSLERKTNQYEIDNWRSMYQGLVLSYYDNPPTLVDENTGEILNADFKNYKSVEKLDQYSKALNEYIVKSIGECPEYYETYILILSNGLKINIDKTIYDTLDKILNKYKV